MVVEICTVTYLARIHFLIQLNNRDCTGSFHWDKKNCSHGNLDVSNKDRRSLANTKFYLQERKNVGNKNIFHLTSIWNFWKLHNLYLFCKDVLKALNKREYTRSIKANDWVKIVIKINNTESVLTWSTRISSIGYHREIKFLALTPVLMTVRIFHCAVIV